MGSISGWDPAKIFDISAKELELIKKRAERRAVLRQEFQKRYTNPYTRGQGGYILDPAVQRFNALRSTQFQYYEKARSNGMIAFGIMVVPIFALTVAVIAERADFRKKLNSGEINPRNRNLYYTDSFY